MPEGGTDHLHYVTALCFRRSRSWCQHNCACLLAHLHLPPGQPISDGDCVFMSVPWVSLFLADPALNVFSNEWVGGWRHE